MGLASAVLLLWAMVYVARSGYDRAFARPLPEDDKRDDELFANLPLRYRSTQLPLVLSLFTHLFWASSLPWVEKFLPGDIPINWKKYDMVVVQFKPQDTALTLPPEFRKKKEEEEDEEERRKRLAAERDDPGIGNLRPLPKKDDPGGEKREAPQRRIEIVVPERPRPKPSAVQASGGAPELAVQLPRPVNPDMAWEFKTPSMGEIPFPNQPSLAQLGVAQPQIGVETLPGLSEALLGSNTVVAPVAGMDPALASLAVAQTIGGDGYSSLLTPQGGDRLLIADLFGDGFGDGWSKGFGDGSEFGGGDEDGTGAGAGQGGLMPLPREVHGIIMVSTGIASLPEAHGVLKGSPIYTVYLEAPGFRRKWIFQVCARENAPAYERTGEVLKVVSRGSLDPPYAMHKEPFVFEDLGTDPLPRRAVIYGAFDERGRLTNLKVVAGADPRTDDVLLAGLREWEFHPAFRDGRPVAVEALFGIPLR